MSIEYNDTEDNSSEDVDLSTELNLGDDKELDFDENFGDLDLELRKATAAKAQGTRFSLKARRAIEDHLEERKLRKEMDYMFNDDFAADDDGSKK